MTDNNSEPAIVVNQQIAYSQKQAAAMLGVSTSHFGRHIRKELPVPVYSGSRILFRHTDLVRWLDKQRYNGPN